MELFFSYPQGRVFYRDSGPLGGPPVFLIHGFGEDGEIWNAQVEALNHKARVMVPDLPGSGKSAFAPGICNSLDEMARLLWTMVQSLTKEPVVLLGHSMGGYIVLAMMEQWLAGKDSLPTVPVAGFGLVHSSAYADSEEKKATRHKAIEFMEQHGGFPFLQTAIPGLFGQAFQQSQPEVVQELVQKAKAFETAALIAYYQAMVGRPDRTEVLRQSRQPVLFLAGEEDKAAPIADLIQQMSLPDLSMVRIWKKIGHMGMLEAPVEMNAAFIDFMNLLDKR